MAQKADAHMFSPEDLADESLFDEEEPQTRPGVSSSALPSSFASSSAPRVVPPRSAKAQKARIRAAKDPDAEALEIVSKVAEKLAVARSLARIASSVVRSFADQKMAEIVESDGGNAIAHVERARRVAMAAKEAAVHAASLAAARAAARTQEFVDEASSLVETLDESVDESVAGDGGHEEAHDDAC
jgi:hypothetical protein